MINIDTHFFREARHVDFMTTIKELSLFAIATNHDAFQTVSNLHRLDHKTSCRLVSGGSRTTQPIKKCHERHVNGKGAILILDHSAPSFDAVSRDKKLASGTAKLMAGKILTLLDHDKKSALLVFGSL